MIGYLKSGDFAKLCNTTKNTLIHYENKRLLLPARIDEITGYRYYSMGQVNRFNAIKALADAGFPLTRVAELLGERDTWTMSSAIEDARKSLNERIFELEDSLARLRTMQSQLYLANAVPIDEVQVVDLPEQYYVAVNEPWLGTVEEYASNPDIVEQDIRTLSQLSQLSPAAGLSPYGMVSQGPIGPGPVKYSRMIYVIEQERDVRALGAKAQRIPAGSYARIASVCPWDDVSPPHRKLLDYVVRNGGDPDEPRYEISAFRLFDSSSTVGFDRYHCLLFMPFEP